LGKSKAGNPVSKLRLPAAKPMATTETLIRRTLPSAKLGPELPQGDPDVQAKINERCWLRAYRSSVQKSLSKPTPAMMGFASGANPAFQMVRRNILDLLGIN
jgi:hypothetical protein